MTNLRFADDVVLIGRSFHQVQKTVADLVEECGRVGLQIHLRKTKLLNKGIGRGKNMKTVEVGELTLKY